MSMPKHIINRHSTPVENDWATHRRTTSDPTLPLGGWTEDAVANAK